MPTVRILAEGQSYLASPGQMCGDTFVFGTKAGDTALLTLDYTGFVGSDTVASSVWSGDITATGPALSGAIAMARFAIPDSACGQYEILNTLTTTNGRVEKTTVVLVAGVNWRAAS